MRIVCANCERWLGESAVPLVFVEHLPKGEETSIPEPRDLRYCKSCGRVNVFVSKADLAGSLARVAP